jgi:hypothetical protein
MAERAQRTTLNSRIANFTTTSGGSDTARVRFSLTSMNPYGLRRGLSCRSPNVTSQALRQGGARQDLPRFALP